MVKILDFGSVKLQMETGPKLTAFGTTLGSPYYMSPEQAMGKLDVDQRTDVFAVAAIAWEMAVGRVCFEGENVAAILMQIVNQDPPPPSQQAPNSGWPPAFDDAVLTGLAKDKTQRPKSAGALADSLVASFGLQGTHAQWGQTPQTEIAAALASATPPAPKAYGAPAAASGGSLPSSPLSSSGQAPSPRSMDHGPAPVPSSGANAMLIVVGALLVLGLLGGAAAYFLM